ncbi:MAG TPA: FKBP-type peptidyl-prolyl cis-trans isomerase, partial [Ferruginibacter sp.]|nr:hypothetical protein [Chitinophagaceae bacterium]HRI25284.1 FKBP-type peptidyl-prolyl cis-trans isomerase [Ferruginibacter sp.]
MKRVGDQMPPFMKKGKYMYTYVKLVNIFKTREQADSANNAEKRVLKPKMFKKQWEEMQTAVLKEKDQLAKDDKIIAAYLAANNIKAEKTKLGTYIAVQTEGTGDFINYNTVATVNYTGKTLDSAIVFDSNVDPKFGHVAPYDVKIWAIGSPEGVIPGWYDALLQMKQGSKVTVYIPSSLGYGASGSGDRIKPNAILVFDIEVKEALGEEAYNAKMMKLQEEAMQKAQEAERNKVDSVQKATNK